MSSEYPPPWVRIKIDKGVFKGMTFMEPYKGRWILVFGTLGQDGEKLTKIVCERKSRPQVVLDEQTKMVFKDMELVYEGTKEQFAYVPKSSSLKFDNVTFTKPT